jgi:hypothetical protein
MTLDFQVRNSRYYGLTFLIVILAGLWWGAWQSLPVPSVSGPGVPLINEFLAANQAGITDQDGDHSDWIEIYNPSPRAINLAGWSLTDDPQEPDKWTFPNVTLGGHEYRLVFASGKNRKPTEPGSELHTSFRIDRDGEFLGLYDLSSSRFVDSSALSAGNRFPEQFQDVSYGCRRTRKSDAVDLPVCGYLSTPTPGQPNDKALLWAGLVAPVSLSHRRGFYSAAFMLELATSSPGATIHYTTDGSEPTEVHGTVYAGPIPITATTIIRAVAFKPDFRASSVDTHTYVFLDQVLMQPANPPGFRASWGAYEGSPVMADYEMDPEVVNDLCYSGALKQALRSIPTISIVTDMQSFQELYANPRQKGRAWERSASVEYWGDADDQQGFQINAGLRIQGELGRLEVIPKHAFRLFFRKEYGAAKLEYPLFPGSPVQEFDTLTLRSGVNRSYAGWPDSDQKPTAYTRDQWLRTSQIAMTGSGSHGIFVHLYLNGLYWGLYNVVERPDEPFMSSYYGGPKDDWQVISHGEALDHSSERFETLHRLAGNGQLEDPEQYAAIQEYLDIPHFVDYLILNWYAGNLDWAFNNWYAGVRRSSGQVRYFVWDGERIWYDGAEIYMGMDEYNGQPNLIKPLFEALLENPDFRITLADRLYKHLFNDGALTDANSKARWINMNNVIQQAIIGESARWGDTREDTPITQEDWFRARDDVLVQMEGNAAKLISLARQAGYYPPVDPPVFAPLNGESVTRFELTMSTPSSQEGIIYYTTDGSDPRQKGTGAVSPNAHRYAGPLVLTSTTQVKARVFSKAASSPWVGQAWSALNEAILGIGNEMSSPLRITEIMYNPVGGDDYEFIELKNVGNVDLNLANASFEGIAFTFPPMAAPLAPGEFTVLVRNPAAFAERYPAVAIGGVYDRSLSNGGERTALETAGGRTLVHVRYDDGNGWPRSPDGRGHSLMLVDLAGDPDNPKSWRASTTPNGSPGTDCSSERAHQDHAHSLFFGLADDAGVVVPVTRMLIRKIVSNGSPNPRSLLPSVSHCPRPEAPGRPVNSEPA